jgi:chemotaxis methyl-accepting protein methylase
MPLTTMEPILERAVGLLRRDLGLRSDPAMLGRLRRCLRDHATAAHLEPEAYLETLTTDPVARQTLFDRVTVQETAFFRHPGQFEALAHVLADMAGPVSIWSAGAANGQEPFSLAMVLEEQRIPGTVLATDVSNRALKRTLTARYLTRELTGLSAARRGRHLVETPGDWTIAPSVRARVTAQHHNLVTDPLPAQLSSCQIVFCRNVLIYFSPEHATAFLTRLASQLPAGAILFLGYAETIWQVTDLFEPVRIGDSFEYHRRRPPSSGPSAGRDTRRPPARVPSAPAPVTPIRVRVERPRPGAVGAPAPVTSPPSPAEELSRTGQTAAAARDYPAAITAFRKCVYLAPDDPIGHLHLGLALEASGDHPAAGRAFAAARAALERAPSSGLEALGGYRMEELVRLLAERTGDRWR